MHKLPTEVHPRVCGEHHNDGIIWRDGVGSSPRVRGTQDETKELTNAIRFIPACAGNTLILQGGQVDKRVHPRVCGEHLCRSTPYTAELGSSPRVRGTQASCMFCFNLIRFIPACAGNTLQKFGKLRNV